MADSSVFLWSAEAILRLYERPMTARDLFFAARDEGLITSDQVRGKTPWQTMKSKLSVHILKHGDNSVFVRTSPGRFYLRDLVESESSIYSAPRWQPPPSRELVTVFPASLLTKQLAFQGIRTSFTRTYDRLFRSGHCFSVPRPTAELTEDYKQIITYVMVRRDGLFLAFRRGVYNQSADMLRGADCIGFGGHVSVDDKGLFSEDDAGIREAAARELSEELDLPDEDLRRLNYGEGLRVVGLLNDDSSSVGRRHFAVVMEYEVSDSAYWDSPKRGEESITKLRWVGGSGDELRLDEYEYWSQLCLRRYAPDLVRLQASFKVRRRVQLQAPHLLCLVGEVGSGKTEAARTLVEHHGYVEVNTGRLVAQLLGVPPVPETPRQKFQSLAYHFIKSPNGPTLLAAAISDRARKLDRPRVLIDGIRQVETLRELRRLRPGERVPVLYVQTAPDIAYQFYRRREVKNADMREFLRVRESPVERDVPLLLSDADAVLYNWFGRGHFVEALDRLLSGSR